MKSSETGTTSPDHEATAFSRRRALGLAGGGLGAAALGAKALAQPATSPPAAPPMRLNLATEIKAELQKLAPGVYAYIQREAAGMSNLSVSNCGVIEGRTSMLAIDATSAPVHAKRFRAAAEKATGKKFDRVVITHQHGDHTLGLQFMGTDLDVIAQEECAAAMARTPTTRPVVWDKTNPAWSDGSETFVVVPANITYSQKMTLTGYGPREVQLLWPNRAHTLGDTNVYLPDEKIIFVGDIGFFGVTPLNGSGYVAQWIRACDEINAMDVKTIVPGHGPVGGKAELEDMKQYLVLLWGESKKAFDRGITPGRAAAEIDLGKYAAWTDAGRIVNNMTRVYSEHAGTIAAAMPPGVVQRAMAEYNEIKGIK